MSGVPLNINFQQIMLHLFNFTILFGMLYILLYKPVKNFMEGRISYYADMDSKATDALQAAEEGKREYDDKIQAFNDEVQEEKNKARKDIQVQIDKQLADAQAEADKIVASAKAEGERKKKEIVDSAQKDIKTLVTDAMEKLATESSSDAFDKFLDAAESESTEK